MSRLSPEAIVCTLLEWGEDQRNEVVNKLRGEGYDLIDELDTGEYTLALWHGTKLRKGMPVRFFEMSLNFRDYDFTEPSAQAGKRPGKSMLGVRTQLIQRVAKWVHVAKELYVGSFDARKLKFYQNFFRRYFPQYSVSEPFKAFDDSTHPDYFVVSP